MTQTTSRLDQKLQDTLEQVGALGRAAGKQLDDARLGTADALNQSASTVRNAGEAIDDLAGKTAARLDSTATCVRNYDLGGVLSNMRQAIRRHPTSFVTGAVAAGYLIGLTARKK